MTYITKLDLTADLDQIKQDLETVLSVQFWPTEDFVKKTSGNQISIKHRPGVTDVFTDGQGSLVNKETGEAYAKEADFSEYNPYLPEYTKSIIEELSNKVGCKFGRIRYMRLMPKTGLSIHSDTEQRYHLVLQTNKGALFGHYTGDEPEVAKCYHIPADGYFYKVDTRLPHFVYNGGWEPRIHLVICEA
jgi:hypothetical protein